VWSTKRFRTQAARCAALAQQTHDEESRQRYLRLQQTYLHLAGTKDQLDSQMSAFVGERTEVRSPMPDASNR